MKNIAIIFGSVCVTLLAVICYMVYSSASAADPNALLEQARIAYCADLGELTQRCYAQDATACDALRTKEDDYSETFSGKQAYVDCVTKKQTAPTIVPKASAQTPVAPLFRGDE
jgi:hypothetical protein